MSRGKHRKLYYVPGLISLFVVPLLFAYLGNNKIQKLDLRVIELNAWHPDLEPMYPLPKRNYKKIVLSGDYAHDKPAIEKSKVFIREMYESNDTINGVHFELQENVSYGTVVGLINFFKTDSISAFAIYDNNIWVLKQPEPKPSNDKYVFICGNLLYDDIVIAKANEDRFFDNIIKTHLPTLAKLWPSLIILLIIVVLSLKKIINYSLSLSPQSTLFKLP